MSLYSNKVLENRNNKDKNKRIRPIHYSINSSSSNTHSTKPVNTSSNSSSSKYYLLNQEILIGVLYLLINILGFTYSWIINSKNPLAALLAPWLQLARGTGFLLNINFIFIFITISKRLLTWLRNTWLVKVYTFDNSIRYHKRTAYIILVLSIVHTIAHIMNFRIIGNADRNAVRDALLQVGTELSIETSETNLHLRTVPGLTGWLALILMVCMYLMSRKVIRKNNFELFWYTHHLFLPIYLLIFIHGFQRIVGATPQFWQFTIIPFGIYTSERLRRYFNTKFSDYYITDIIHHPPNTLELQININYDYKSEFHYKPGQYVLVCIPYISRYQWHPFTISSAPEDSYLSLHIRQEGNWTKDLERLLTDFNTKTYSTLYFNNNKFRIFLDGPFGAATEDVFNFKTVVLIGGGIGVTPFASVLKTINHRIEANINNVKLPSQLKVKIKKIYFYWICKNMTDFEWFYQLLLSLESKKINDLLDINIHFTGDLPEYQRVKLKQLRQSRRLRDTITGLHTITARGRPNWDEVFDDIVNNNNQRRSNEKDNRSKEDKIGIFLCGNKGLSRSVKLSSLRHKEILRFHKENF